jgi:hypothetical protein
MRSNGHHLPVAFQLSLQDDALMGWLLSRRDSLGDGVDTKDAHHHDSVQRGISDELFTALDAAFELLSIAAA